MNHSDETNITEKRFEAIKFAILKRLSDEMFGTDADIVRYADNIAVRASGKCLGQSSLKHYEFKYPADWWQAVKERFAPAWFLRRYPVKYIVTVVDIDAVYPELHKKLHLPDEHHFYSIKYYTRD